MSIFTRGKNPEVIRIATRKSPLAIWQAEHIAKIIQDYDPDIKIEYVPLSTKGDEILDKKLADIGGKEVFVKNLEQALLDNKADIAVHSLKDIPSKIYDKFYLSMFSKRENPRDALLTKNYQKLEDLPKKSVIGTGSPRRVAQLKALGFKNTKLLRGNIARRIQQLAHKDSKYDAIIIAYAALLRLKLRSLADDIFSIDQMIPAPGQGVVAVECLSKRSDLIKFFKKIDDEKVRREVTVERFIAASLDGDCHSPVGIYADLISQEDTNLFSRFYGKTENKMDVKIIIASPKTGEFIRYDKIFNDKKKSELGDILKYLIDKGAKELLREI